MRAIPEFARMAGSNSGLQRGSYSMNPRSRTAKVFGRYDAKICVGDAEPPGQRCGILIC